MKAEIRKSKKVDFKPFKLVVSVETIEDLKELHNMFNLSPFTINEELGNDWCKGFDIKAGVHKAFKMLDNKLNDFNHKL